MALAIVPVIDLEGRGPVRAAARPSTSAHAGGAAKATPQTKAPGKGTDSEGGLAGKALKKIGEAVSGSLSGGGEGSGAAAKGGGEAEEATTAGAQASGVTYQEEMPLMKLKERPWPGKEIPWPAAIQAAYKQCDGTGPCIGSWANNPRSSLARDFVRARRIDSASRFLSLRWDYIQGKGPGGIAPFLTEAEVNEYIATAQKELDDHLASVAAGKAAKIKAAADIAIAKEQKRIEAYEAAKAAEEKKIADKEKPAAPAEQAPAEQAPAEQAPAEQAPAEQAPAEQAPAEQAPAETPAEVPEEKPAGETSSSDE